MGFRREKLEDEKDGYKWVAYKSESGHPWLFSVDINHEENPITVTINIKQSDDEGYNAEAVQTIKTKLVALEDFMAGRTTASDADLNFITILERRGIIPIDEVTFEAGPTSPIRSVLSQANIPRDIQAAVMEELQQIWAKTPK